MEPPEAALMIFPQEADNGMCLGTFTWVWSVMRASWLYSELPQPNISPLSKMKIKKKKTVENREKLYTPNEVRMLKPFISISL